MYANIHTPGHVCRLRKINNNNTMKSNKSKVTKMDGTAHIEMKTNTNEEKIKIQFSFERRK